MRFVLFLLILAPLLLQAEAYRYVDPKTGETVFTDKPPARQKSEPIKLKSPTISKPYPVAPREESPQEAEPSRSDSPAFTLKILSPENEENIRANDGKVIVTVGANQPLGGQKGFLIRFILDGKPVALTAALSTTLTNLDRGAHTISAELINKNGKVLAAAQPHTFYVQRHSILHKKPAQGAPPKPSRPVTPGPGPRSPGSRR